MQRNNKSVIIAEQALIGSAMLVYDRMTEAVDGIRAEHFADPYHGKVWTWAQDVRESGRDVNPITVCEHAERQGIPASEYDFALLVELCNSTPGTAGVKAYAQIIKQGWRDRMARGIGAELMDDVGTEGDAVGKAITALMNLDREDEASEVTGRQAIAAAYRDIEAAFEADGDLVGVPTGLKKLDEAIGGWHPGDLTIVQARPSMGKTALMLFFAKAAANAGRPCGIISAEQPANQIAMRQLAMDSGVKVQSMRSAKMEDFEWSSVTNSVAKLSRDPIRIFDRSAPSLATVASQARKWVRRDGMQVMFVDYLQRVTADAERRSEEVSKVARGLKTLARDLNIPIIALAQSKRDCDDRGNKRPGMADISDSSECEKEADGIISLFRDEVYDPKSDDAGTAELILCKNRHGPVGMIRCAFNGGLVRFGELANVDRFRG